MDIAKREYWTRQLEEFKKSDLTVTKWCEENKVILSSFKYYKQKLSGGASKKEETTKFVALNVTEKKPKNERLPLVVKIGHASVEVSLGCDMNILESVISILVKQC
ncbi:MAG: IS66 family insertion sequence element accessory protein TnpA [Alkaliphilus sp.]